MVSVVSALRSGLLSGCRWLASLLLICLALALVNSILMRYVFGTALSLEAPLIEISFQWLALTALPIAIDEQIRRAGRGASAVAWAAAAVLAAFAMFAASGLDKVEFSLTPDIASGYGMLAYPWGFGLGAIVAALAAPHLRKRAG